MSYQSSRKSDDTYSEIKIVENNAYMEREDAVLVRYGYKHYGSKKKRIDVLVNFNMNVKCGTMGEFNRYGLLGPSGAGKTSLLSCLVGRKQLNSGEVWVFGGRPGTKNCPIPGRSVGYMPQELALYGEFTMRDMMLYFGWIYGMTRREISDRMQFLMELLELRTKNRKIKNLSGGQQRRVSLAVALMHDPELLILDEPTVGVDPVLRQTIWKHLVELVAERQTTVIITTHYIEEARQAHTIGLMRRGRLLAEDSPENLLRTYKLTSLEAVFLELAYNQVTTTPDEPIVAKQSSITNHKRPKKPFTISRKNEFKLNLSQMRALVFKNFLTLWRNPGILLFFLALPVVQVILFCTAIGGEPTNLPLAVVNDEVPNLQKTNSCPIQSGCVFKNLSCRYLKHLDATIMDIVYFDKMAAARKSVENGDNWGVAYFHQNFSSATLMRQMNPSDENLRQSTVVINLDMSDQQISYMMQRDLMKSYMEFGKELLRDCKKDEKIMDLPVLIKDPIYGTEKPSFKDFTAPGIILTIIFFLAVGQTAISLISEQIEGMLDRTSVAGVTPTQILGGHVLCQFIIMCVQVFLVLFFTLQVFQVQCEGSIFWLVILTVLVGVCGMCYGYVISAACDVERTAIEIALGSFYPCIILSGVIWPVEGMHYVLRTIAYCTPLTLPIASIRAVMSRGWGITKTKVYMGFVGSIIWTVLFLAIVVLILKFKKR